MKVVTDVIGILGITDTIGQRLVFSDAEKRALMRASEIVGRARELLRDTYGEEEVESWELDLDLATVEHNAADLAREEIHLNAMVAR